jgi:Tfp pilus assembly protein PilV
MSNQDAATSSLMRRRWLTPSRSYSVCSARRIGGARSHGSQQGASLVEVLISVVLVGVVILGLAAGMLTLIGTSTSTSERQQIQLALGSFTESLKAGTYEPCTSNSALATPATYQAAYEAWPSKWTPPQAGMTRGITRVEYWDSAQAVFVDSCPNAGDQGTQRLTVQVDWQGRSGTAQVVIAKLVSQ